MSLRFAVVLALALAAGVPASRAEVPSVTGRVTAAAPATLPANAELIVRVYDVSKMDAPAKLMGEQRQSVVSLPLEFQVFYDPAMILAPHTYAASARIEAGGRLLYISTRTYHVITRDHPTRVDLEVEPVARRN
ncbi:MAG TPA: YbaY family lipoprotein [Pelomicrobium sp.]|nr:YbaY family lipoprotein [Pelomicrobium sp.]